MPLIAITHVPSPQMHAGLRTFLDRAPIDANLAMRQHVEFRRLLSQCGALVRTIDVNRELPDCAFVEDCALVLDEVAVLTTMGAPERRRELPAVGRELARHRRVVRLEPPGLLEGGDVLRIERTLLVGISARTDIAGVRALEVIVKRHGYDVVAVPVRRSLHLKTACTALDDRTLLINSDWIDTTPLARFELVRVPANESWAANVVRVGDRICMGAGNPRTMEMIRARGMPVEAIDLSEFAKAEAGITCLSLLFEGGASL
jgi:dimethylargininase